VLPRDRTILRLAVPALATLAVEPMYVLVDTAIVGHLGTGPLGGLALAAGVLNIAFLVCNFLAYGTTARVAFLVGAGDRRAADHVAAQGLWLSAFLGLAAAALVGGLARPAATLLGGSGEVLENAVTYLRISAIGTPFVLVALVGNGYLRGVQDTRTPLVIAVAANLLNLIVEIVFVYGLDLGVAGSAWGTVIAQTVAASVFLAILSRRLRESGASLRVDREELTRLVRVGRHLFIRTAALLATLTLATSVAARMDAPTLAGHQIALQIETFLALVVDGLAIAGQTLTGSALGAGDRIEARLMGRRLVQLGLRAGMALAGVVVATSWLLPHAFTADGAVVSRASAALVLVGVLQVPAAVVFVLDGVLLGASDSRFQQWANVLALVAFLPFVVLLLLWPTPGIVGIWAGLMVWMLARLVANLTRFAGSHWERSAA
jgi:putative MATE family efflux protein